MITVSYNAYCAITKEGDKDIWTARPREVVLLLPLWSQIDVGATVNALLGDTFSRENNTHGSRFHERDPHFASRILGAMFQSCYIGTRDIRSRVIRGLYCIEFAISQPKMVRLPRNEKQTNRLNSGAQMWPSGLTLAMTLTLNFQGQIWNLLYLSQKWSDCHETKSKHIDWTPGLKCDQWVWPWP